MREFLDAMESLGDKLGPLLVQLPPDFTADERPALQSFLASLPSSFRFAVEFRHRSWLDDSTLDLLRENQVAWTNADLYYMPRRVELTTDFTYVRWLGDRRKITSMHAVQIDRRPELDTWAEKLEDFAGRVERVYGFANNHYSGHSPSDMRYLRQRLGLQDRAQPEDTPIQRTLL
jgi:uncharacterized protein YecE (DUF72 family)